MSRTNASLDNADLISHNLKQHQVFPQHHIAFSQQIQPAIPSNRSVSSTVCTDVNASLVAPANSNAATAENLQNAIVATSNSFMIAHTQMNTNTAKETQTMPIAQNSENMAEKTQVSSGSS